MNNKISSQQVTRSSSNRPEVPGLATKGTMKNSGGVSIEQTKTPKAVTLFLEFEEDIIHKDQSPDSPVTNRFLEGVIRGDEGRSVRDAEGNKLVVRINLEPGKEYGSEDLDNKVKSSMSRIEALFINAVKAGHLDAKNTDSIEFSVASRPAHFYTTDEKSTTPPMITTSGNKTSYDHGRGPAVLVKPYTGKLAFEQIRQEPVTGNIEINQEKLRAAQDAAKQSSPLQPTDPKSFSETPMPVESPVSETPMPVESPVSETPMPVESPVSETPMPVESPASPNLLPQRETDFQSGGIKGSLPHVHTRKENQAWIAGAVAALVGGIAAFAAAGVAKGNDPQDTVDSLDATADELDNAANDLEANRDAIIQKAGEQVALDVDIKARGEAWEEGIAAYEAGDTDTVENIFDTKTLDPDAEIQQEVIFLDGALTDQINAEAEARGKEVEAQVSAHIDNTVNALRSKATAQRVQADILAEQAKKVATDADTEFAFGALGLAAGIAFSARYLLNHHHNSQANSSYTTALGEEIGQSRFNGIYRGGDSVVEVKA